MFSKTTTKYYIVDIETYVSLQNKDLREVSKYLDTLKSYESWDDAEAGFVQQMFSGDKQTSHCTVIEFTRTVRDYSKLYGILFVVASVICSIVGAYYLTK